MTTHNPIKWIECVSCGKRCPKRGRGGVTCMRGSCTHARMLDRQKANRAGMTVEQLALARKAATINAQMRRARIA